MDNWWIIEDFFKTYTYVYIIYIYILYIYYIYIAPKSSPSHLKLLGEPGWPPSAYQVAAGSRRPLFTRTGLRQEPGSAEMFGTVKFRGPKEALNFWEGTPQKKIWLVVLTCFNHLEKYESQWEGWHPIYEMAFQDWIMERLGWFWCVFWVEGAILAVDDDYPDKTLLDHHPGLAYLLPDLPANDVFPSRPLLSSKPTMII